MAFVTLRESWRGLVPMKRRESLAQVRIQNTILGDPNSSLFAKDK